MGFDLLPEARNGLLPVHRRRKVPLQSLKPATELRHGELLNFCSRPLLCAPHSLADAGAFR